MTRSMQPLATSSPAIGRRVAAHLLVTHAFPTLAVTFASAGLGIIVAGPSISLLVAVMAVFASQVAVGSLNDYLDRELDAKEQPTKPIPSGLIAPSVALVQSIVATVLCLTLAALTGPIGFVLATLGLVSGQAYNLWLKGTVLSALPYLVSFACLPPFVLIAVGAFRAEWLVLYPVGIPLVLSFHLANALPDVTGDTRLGSQSLVARLGMRPSLALCWVAYLAAVALSIWLETSMTRADNQLTSLPGPLAALMLLLLAIGSSRSGSRLGLLNHFRLVVIGGLVLLGSLVLHL